MAKFNKFLDESFEDKESFSPDTGVVAGFSTGTKCRLFEAERLYSWRN